MNKPRSKLFRSLRGLMLNHMPLMINCRQFEDFIIDYLEDDLERRQKTIFELHLKVCRDCRGYLEAYKRAVEIGRAAFDDPEGLVPEDVPKDLVRAVLAARDV